MIQGHPYEVINGIPFSKWKGVAGSTLYLVNTMNEFMAFWELLMKKNLVACDTETNGFRYYKGDRIVGMSFGWGLDHFYIPVRHLDSVSCGAQLPQLSMDDIRPYLQQFFARTDCFTIWSNGRFDRHFYKADGIEIKTPFHDTIFLWKFYDENAPAALKTVCSGWTDIMGRKIDGVVGPEAAAHEKEIGKWRTEEAKARKAAFSRDVIATTDMLRSDMEYQHMNRNELKKHVRTVILKDHPYANSVKDDVHYGYIPIELMVNYAATDTFLSWQVYEFCLRNIKFTEKLRALYINELELSLAIFDAEEGGVEIDEPYLAKLSVELGEKASELKARITEAFQNAFIAKHNAEAKDLPEGTKLDAFLDVVDVLENADDEVNLNSNDQLASALQAMGAVLTKTTESGKLKVDKKVLDSLKGDFPVVKDILDMRAYLKIKNTYADSIREKLVDGNILHCSFNQNVSTGRMSASDPNLTNIPNRDDSIRKAFLCPPGYVYVLADYSQIEIRLTAHYSNDPILKDAYAKGQDIHTRTTSEMFGIPYDEIHHVIEEADKSNPKFKEYKDLRNIGKKVGFSIIYGTTEIGLSEQIERPSQYANTSDLEWQNICANFIEKYLYTYLGVKRFINDGTRQVRKNAYVENHFGRVRHLPHAHATKITGNDKLFWMHGRAERQGVNAIIQSTAADLFKMAVVRVHKLLRGTKSRMVNFVHDEIQIYLHMDDLHLVPKIKEAMEDFKFNVPIIAEVDCTTTNWADKHKFKMEDFQ